MQSHAMIYKTFAMLYVQVGDLKGLFGLFTVYMQMLRTKLKVLDISYGNSTGLAGILVSLCIFSSKYKLI